jgi:pSer/pThr/pTyr-binding forkhead associated (FHA) protein
MNERVPSLHLFDVELPEGAPRVRITAGLGSAAQKTWNLRRPVTLIGSRRPAHIILHDRDISPAHCVIINTGTEILLKDLHTRGGTRCGDENVDLAVLKDGDVLTVGINAIQVAIQAPADAPDDSGYGVKFSDPTTFPTPVTVGLLHTDQHWGLQEAVTLIGRHENAPIFLDHERVSRRHAILFRFKNNPAIFDLGGQEGILVNGRPCSIAPLSDGDRITIGPFGLLIGSDEGAGLDMQASGHEPTGDTAAQTEGIEAQSDRPVQGSPSTNPVPDAPQEAAEDACSIDSQLDSVRNGVADSWEHLNSWQSELLDEATALSKQETVLTSRRVEFEARDAALRGQLHDVERMQEQLEERESQLSAERAQLYAENESLAEDQKACSAHEAQVTRRAEELSRREHVIAQRWGRLHTMTCPHCGKPIGGGDGSSSGPGA